MKNQDLTGLRFGMLTVLMKDGRIRDSTAWLCQCDCGNTSRVRTATLNNGHNRSCGCQRGAPTHGHTRGVWKDRKNQSITYNSWRAMHSRCRNRSSAGYEYYKTLGVTVCERWHLFENFLADMGERPSLKHSLDRYPDKTGSYEPGNCRWATRKEQSNNLIKNNVFDVNGEQLTLSQISDRYGISYERLRHRIIRAGWSVEAAITTDKSQGRPTKQLRLSRQA